MRPHHIIGIAAAAVVAVVVSVAVYRAQGWLAVVVLWGVAVACGSQYPLRSRYR